MSKYVDTTAIMQVIGSVYNNPSLLDATDKYPVNEQDFYEPFHKIIFGAMYQMYETGITSFTVEAIADFFAGKPKSLAIFESNKGDEYLAKLQTVVQASSFDYYYKRMKKMTLLRVYDSYGIDVSRFYNPDNILNPALKEEQETWLDNSSLEDMADAIDSIIEKARAMCLDDTESVHCQAGDGLLDYLETLKMRPEVGSPLYGTFINRVSGGARMRKFYIRSAPSGVGKTRTMVADACNLGVDKIYIENRGWVDNGVAEPVLFITTELEIQEVQTMMLAFLSNVNEERILYNTYKEGEEARVLEAAKLLSNSQVFIEFLPQFSLKDVENTIKRSIREHDVKYVFYDYIHTSIKILEEITRQTGGIRLREDNILFMLSARLKDLCNQYGVFIMSATQLNGDYKYEKIPDQNLLRGAKAIADKVDIGMILLPVTAEDIEALGPLTSQLACNVPKVKLSIYKNRRGRYKDVFLWCDGDLGTCRINPMFCTDFNYTHVDIKEMDIAVDSGAY